MDLQYPSRGNVDIIKQLNRLDRPSSKLTFTVNNIPSNEPIPASQKECIVKMIKRDQHVHLLRYLQKEVIYYDKQIGAKGTGWNILHCCAKYDAFNCTKTILKRMYQDSKDEYIRIVNSQTAEGYTPLMVTIIHQAQNTLQLLLHLGGSDLYIIEASKLRAYDLAINYHNDKAIQQLIGYQNICKKTMFLNDKELNQVQQLPQEKSWYDSLTSYLINCFICFHNDDCDDPDEKGSNFIQKLNMLMGKEETHPQEQNDLVKIGSEKDYVGYEIEWKKLSTLTGQQMALFRGFKPMDISQNHFYLRNQLIIFQTLSDFSWIIKRAIAKMEQKFSPNKQRPKNHERYSVTLFKNFVMTKVMVDECVPVLKESQDIMFLTDSNQIWPVILQKALAKIQGSYIQLSTIHPVQFLQEITGFYTKSFPLVQLASQTSLASKLQQLSLKGYLILLQGRENTDLNQTDRVISYSVLSYYQKGSSKKILVNCPLLLKNWKEGKQNRQLAVMKAHFSKHNQSCVWIDEAKLDFYFKNVVICFLKENFVRNQLKIIMEMKGQSELKKDIVQEGVRQYKRSIFFKFTVENHRDEPIMLQLVDVQTKQRYDLHTLQGWKNEGSEPLVVQTEYQKCNELIKLSCHPGEYTCMIEIRSQSTLSKQSQLSTSTSKSILKLKKQKEHQKLFQQGTLKIQSELSSSEEKKRVRLNVGPSNPRELILLNWSMDPIQTEYIEEQFGTIEWLSYLKNYSITNWSSLMNKISKDDEDESFIYEAVNNKILLLIRKSGVKNVFLQLSSEIVELYQFIDGRELAVLEGEMSRNEGGISTMLMREPKNPTFFYMVASNFSSEIFQQQKMRFIYEYE